MSPTICISTGDDMRRAAAVAALGISPGDCIVELCSSSTNICPDYHLQYNDAFQVAVNADPAMVCYACVSERDCAARFAGHPCRFSTADVCIKIDGEFREHGERIKRTAYRPLFQHNP